MNMNRNGFTLIELMIVVIIIAALAAMVAPNLMNRADEAKEKIAQGDLSSIGTALKLYKLDTGSYPTTEQGLDVLMTAGKREPYLEKKPVDPWGRKYQYRCPGVHNSAGFDIYSVGKDGKDGSDDEVVNWER
jgi:general secretion pathway protein G